MPGYKIKKVVFLLESISQPRCIKRVKSFINNGFEVKVYGIDRGKYNVNAKIKGMDINVFSNQNDNKDYFSKLYSNISEVGKIYNEEKNAETVFYSFGFMLTLALRINGCKSYIYEISDIIYGYKKFDTIRWLIKFLDKKLIKKSTLTVMTSIGFSNFLFGSNMPSNVHIQPNKLDGLYWSSQMQQNYKPICRGKICFAFVGAFRYPNTIFRFARIIGELFPMHQFHFYGDSSLTQNVKDLANAYSNIKYFGRFKNPEDIARIYTNIDIVVACYDAKGLNERIAEPNKLYESLYFKKPIIVSENTFLADQVKNMGCGFSINASEDSAIVSFLETLSTDRLIQVMDNLEKIPPLSLIDDNASQIIGKLNLEKVQNY